MVKLIINQPVVTAQEAGEAVTRIKSSARSRNTVQVNK